MAQRSNHYEAAFEAFIRSLRVPCVAVDEAKRASCGDDALKNPDFLLYPRFGSNLVVEVKGKRAKNARGRRDWENWVTTVVFVMLRRPPRSTLLPTRRSSELTAGEF